METQSAAWPAAPQRAMAVGALANLRNRITEVSAGCDVLVDRAEPKVRPTAEACRALHARHADSVVRHLADPGIEADPDGSFMATVNRVVVSARAVFDETDADVMDSIRKRERNVTAAIDKAPGSMLPPEPDTDPRGMRDERCSKRPNTSTDG